MAECKNTGEVQQMLKRLFAGTIKLILEAEMEEFLGYEKHSIAGDNTGNSRNGEFQLQVIGKPLTIQSSASFLSCPFFIRDR